jgi:hypothetical protein
MECALSTSAVASFTELVSRTTTCCKNKHIGSKDGLHFFISTYLAKRMSAGNPVMMPDGVTNRRSVSK